MPKSFLEIHLIHIAIFFFYLFVPGPLLDTGNHPVPVSTEKRRPGIMEYQQEPHPKAMTESQTMRRKHSTENPKQKSSKRLARALLLNGTGLGLNSIKYWIKYSQWIEDWQFELTWEDQKRRIFTGEGYKFDSNPFLTNWTHTLSGAIYYNFARYNRLSTLESMLFMLGFNLVWEYVTEWREVISVGDNICSGIGGITIGEPLYWIGSYFTQKKGLGNKILGLGFNPVVAVNDFLDNHKQRSALNLARFPDPRFDLYFGPIQSTFGQGDPARVQFNTGINVRYYTVEGYGEPGVVNRFSGDTLFSEMAGDITFGINSLEEYRLFTRSILFGWFKQDIRSNASEDYSGYNFILGAGTAFDYFKKKSIQYYDKGEYHYDFQGGEVPFQPTEFTDKLAVMNLIGPVFEISLYSGPFRLRTSVGAYFDFGLINSMAINEYSLFHDLTDPRIKTTLAYYGYYYALGYTLASDLDITCNTIRLQGKIKYQSYDSIEGLDRFQEELEDDANVRDIWLVLKVSLAINLKPSPVSVLVAYEFIGRDGWFKEIIHSTSEDRLYTGLRISL